GRRDDRGVQPRLSQRRHRGHRRGRIATRDARRAQAGDHSGHGGLRGLPVSVDARPRLVTTGRGMRITQLWLQDFRNYTAADLEIAADGLTVVTGGNGEGKTNLLEAIGYLATLDSFRGAPVDALLRAGATSAIVRAEGEREGRKLLIETE